MKYGKRLFGGLCALVAASCGHEELPQPTIDAAYVSLEDVAVLLASLPIGTEQMEEVHDAASSSAGNGYDEEYRMRDLLANPGRGVGETGSTKAREYLRPMRDLLAEALARTKASGDEDRTEAYLAALSLSDVQIYWPFSERWDGTALPVITYDPGDEAAVRNVGYALRPDGGVEKLVVDEQMASERPVWVVNRNSDADYKSLELRRREDPSWGSGGGDIMVLPDTKADSDFKTLVLRSFKAMRQFDCWFAGGSEFFVKMGAIDDFSASTEAELRLYEPSITDFMIVVRRSQVGEAVPFNAILVSEWTKDLYSSAFMIIEDDGGTRTSWKTSAVVKYNSKSYGFEIEIPLNTRDDIVWRGALTRDFIEKYSGKTCAFGDVELVLELI